MSLLLVALMVSVVLVVTNCRNEPISGVNKPISGVNKAISGVNKPCVNKPLNTSSEGVALASPNKTSQSIASEEAVVVGNSACWKNKLLQALKWPEDFDEVFALADDEFWVYNCCEASD